MQKELYLLIDHFIKTNGVADPISRLFYIYKESTHYIELTKEICKLYDVSYSESLKNYLMGLGASAKVYSNQDWYAEKIDKMMLEFCIVPGNDLRGAASIMDTGLFDFKQK